jgi:hypothetical protein
MIGTNLRAPPSKLRPINPDYLEGANAVEGFMNLCAKHCFLQPSPQMKLANIEQKPWESTG